MRKGLVAGIGEAIRTRATILKAFKEAKEVRRGGRGDMRKLPRRRGRTEEGGSTRMERRATREER